MTSASALAVAALTAVAFFVACTADPTLYPKLEFARTWSFALAGNVLALAAALGTARALAVRDRSPGDVVAGIGVVLAGLALANQSWAAVAGLALKGPTLIAARWVEKGRS